MVKPQGPVVRLLDEMDDLEQFCAAQHPRLVRGLALYTGDAGLAEELAQEALVRAIRQWEDVREMVAPGAWVHRVGLNLAKSRFRRRHAAARARRRLGAGTDGWAEDPDSAEAVEVRRALAALPERQRAAVVLRYVNELTVAETADVLGCPEGTVKTLCHRGRAALSNALVLDPEVLS